MKKFDINNIFETEEQVESVKATAAKVHKAIQGEWSEVPSWDETKTKGIVDQWGSIYSVIAKKVGKASNVNPIALFSYLSKKYNPNYQILGAFLCDIRTIRNRMVYDNQWVELDSDAMDLLELCKEFCEYVASLPLLEDEKVKREIATK